MKFTTAIAVAAVAVVTNAQAIQFASPTVGTKWTAGKTEYIAWTGTCANLGAAGKSTIINIVFGDPSALQHKDVLGKIDCTNSNLTYTNLKVPENLASGTAYVLQAMTDPQSYSPAFTIDGAAPLTSNPPPANTDAAKSAGNSLTAPSAMLVVAGVVAALAL
ncbi:hypothetical protein BG006_005478 [Podila minutissima]|uniref:Uncharacterized protein n=1 Tax=Podila minutissima TaxID=64525 RepID=A0A9P5SJY5_9FUNG|nr:hypothetical protein BG006_005478 [Podila minutissima]